MKIKSLVIVAATLATMTACSDNNKYIVDVNVDPTNDGTMAYMYDYDTNDVIDSAVVSEGKAVFTGEIDQPSIVRLEVNGTRAGVIILEKGEITVTDGEANSDLNNKLTAFFDNYIVHRDSLNNKVEEAVTDAEKELCFDLMKMHLDSMVSAAIAENVYNPIGYYLFLQQATQMEADKFEQFLIDNPHFANYKRVEAIKKNFDAYEATSAGKQYTDFEIEYNGTTTKLSDYVKPGQYTLVDFWASWCGPCKREIAIIKQLYDKYHDKGLDVVSVTVWEDPANTEAYLAENPLPWNVMLNGQKVPTDIYGINGIPCIMLIDPEGNIVKRDLFDEDLVNTVAQAMGDEPTETE